MDSRFLAIDLKNFYAAAECVARNLDPMTTNLVVADESRTEKTICLAVSPTLKSLGLGGRCRLFEVVQTVKKVNERRLFAAPGYKFTDSSCDMSLLDADPSLEISYIIAPPRMTYYLDLSAKIYSIYLRHIAPEDIFSYSIDEVFIDVTGYLAAGKMSARQFAAILIEEVQNETGVRITELDEYSYRAELWDHRPLTDFCRVGKGTARKLESEGIYTMGDLAEFSMSNQEWLYKAFRIDAEILIDHAWGVEPCTMKAVKEYKPSNNSICDGQVLPEPYPNDKAKLIVREMADNIMYQLMEQNMTTDMLTMDIGYDRKNCDNGTYKGKTKIDSYGRKVPLPAHGSIHLDNPTNLGSLLIKAASELFERISDKSLSIRRITITANNVEPDAGYAQMDLFTDTKKAETEKQCRNPSLRFGRSSAKTL